LPRPAGPQGIVGREPELRRVDELLDAIEAGPMALVIEGEIGIGKTALWKHGLAAAANRSHRVLACRPIDAEAQLAYAALGDLLAEVPEGALAELPGPQRRALEVALLRAEPEEQRSLPRAVALGLLGVLRALARQAPTLVAIDDVQDLDHPSESALAFAARRLTDERVGLLLARRLDGRRRVLPDLDRALPEGRMGRLRLGALTVAELDRLLGARLRASFPRLTLARLHRVSGGNPFFALEVGGALLRTGDPRAPLDDLPVPASLQGLVRDRLALLDPAALLTAQLAAALSRPTVALIASVMGGHDGVEAAAAAGVVELDGDRVRFAHPLLASVAYAQLPRRAGGSCTRRSPGSWTIPRNGGGILRWPQSTPTPRWLRRSTRPPGGRGLVARRTPRPSCGSRLAGSARPMPGRRSDDAGSRRPNGTSRPATSSVRERCWRRPSPTRRRAGTGRAHSRASAGCARTGRASAPARTSSAPPWPSTATTSRSASRSRRAWRGACTRQRAWPPPRSTRAPRSSSRRHLVSRRCWRARCRMSRSWSRCGAMASRWRRSNAQSGSGVRRDGRRSSAGPTGSTRCCCSGPASSAPPANGSRRCTATPSTTARSTRCRPSCSSSPASSC
jgi:hypothetical protein